jgi:glycosyltransferase involved in cell wall biosynthesis
MSEHTKPVLSVVVPLYNEAASLPHFYASLQPVLKGLGMSYEIVYVNDGSIDQSAQILEGLVMHDETVNILTLTRNFGKEIATTAGIHAARGQAIITLDADGQMPVEAIPEFVKKWKDGAKVVVGVSISRQSSTWKRVGSQLFYGLFRRLTGIKTEPNTTDFRLIDRSVQVEFNRMNERNRITRGLIDWLGYERSYVRYSENSRLAGNPTQSFRKLLKLAIDSAVSLSISPLYLTAYIGAVVLPLATLIGLGMILNWLFGDPLNAHATAGAYVAVFTLFLIGVLLVSQGIIGLYLSHIHTETQNRPLYVVDEARSKVRS